ncbi:MAG: hypothetical protein ACUVRM_10015, partial [Bacillota bacterium]
FKYNPRLANRGLAPPLCLYYDDYEGYTSSLPYKGVAERPGVSYRPSPSAPSSDEPGCPKGEVSWIQGLWRGLIGLIP